MNIDDLSAHIHRFLQNDPQGAMPEKDGGWLLHEAPLAGAASADDPLFEEMKKPEAAGPMFRAPKEWLPAAGTVLSFFLPFTEEVRRSNRVGDEPSWPWLYARIEGGEAMVRATRSAVRLLAENGIAAAAPGLHPDFKVGKFASSWSERHVAFIAGLGTFGLSKSLITKKGPAGRLASLVIEPRWPVTARPYSGLYEYCDRCGFCLKKCPAQAIDMEAGKAHQPCSDFLDRMRLKYAPRYGCGKCQGEGCRHFKTAAFAAAPIVGAAKNF